jgi:KUP system potassium uptake protein
MLQTVTEPRAAAAHAPHGSGRVALGLAALGVVFGDIGTSPLYALHTVFTIDGGAVTPTPGDVYGVVSLVFWTITIVVSVKYVTFLMRVDNEGEGGIMALTALVERIRGAAAAATATLVTLGIIGASLFYGDGVITPAISVLSAVEGLEVASPSLSSIVVPASVVILTGLFAIQRWGTQRVGRLFGPVMAVWFLTIAAAGLREVLARPAIVKGLSPSYAITFAAHRPGSTFIAMGAVVLAVTGAEALYADMGHFGREPIRRAWFLVVFPALTLNYLGQAGIIVHDPKALSNPFFVLLPSWSRIPMVALATAATVIASQAVISGAFSISRQAVRLGFLPRLTIRHTSPAEIGQVYVPAVNGLLFVVVVALVIGFGSSARLASAYGVAVSGTFITTTILFLAVARLRWHVAAWKIALGGLVFGGLEVTFLAANITKIPHGGWLPLVIGTIMFTVMTTWHRGRDVVTAKRTAEEGPLGDFIEHLREARPPIPRVPGTAIFPNPSMKTTPLAFRANVEHNHVVHERVVIISADVVNVPHVPPSERVRIDDLGYGDDGISHVCARYGFLDDPNLIAALRLAVDQGLECDRDLHRASYFVSRISIRVTGAPGMARWRKRLFVVMARNASSPIDYFGLPVHRTIITGQPIDL